MKTLVECFVDGMQRQKQNMTQKQTEGDMPIASCVVLQTMNQICGRKKIAFYVCYLLTWKLDYAQADAVPTLFETARTERLY